MTKRSSFSEKAYKLAHHLAALPETAMREQVLMEYIKKGSLNDVIEVLDEIQKKGRQGGPPFNIALLTLTQVLSSHLVDYELLASLYQTAKEEQREALAQLFYTAPFEDSQTPLTNSSEGGSEMTLGHRKTLARISGRENRERWIRDPDPQVIHSFLENPKITEEDVVRLAALRPTTAQIQQEVFSAKRWIRRYRVKRALALNPYTPVSMSIKLCTFLSKNDLELIISSPTLPNQLREAADKIIKQQLADKNK